MTETLSPSTTEETKFLQNFPRKNDENQPSQNHPLFAADSSPSVTTNTSPLDIQLDPTESKPSPMTYVARVRFGIRVRVRVRVRDSAIKKLLKIFLFIFLIYY